MKAFPKDSVDPSDRATRSMLLYNAGTVHTSMGLFEKAKQSLLEALQIRRDLQDADTISATLNNLGLLHNSIHEFNTAEQHYREALTIHEQRPDSEDRKLSITMVRHNLQRNAIQSGKDLPGVDEVQTTIDTFKTTISWWMLGQ
jgi:tetratricopeptide (TPR) repeat protein